MPIDLYRLTDPNEKEYQITQLKRHVEREFKLPLGAVDKVEGDLLRLFVWRDTKTDPGPLTYEMRILYGQKYFDELYRKNKRRGDFIFRSFEEAANFFRDNGFTKYRRATFVRNEIIATIMQKGIIYIAVVMNTETETEVASTHDL